MVLMNDAKYRDDIGQVYHLRYVREYRSVAVLWGFMSIVWCILNVVIFVQPQWIGDTKDSIGYGHAGVYSHCYPDPTIRAYVCDGSFTDFNTIINDSFKATAFFVGLSALLMLICIAALLLFFCFKKKVIFIFCGVLEIVTGVLLFLACVIYPSGWDNNQLQLICGRPSIDEPFMSEYNIGQCGVRWGYILAILGIFDAIVLGSLSLVLAMKEEKSTSFYQGGMVTKSELNGYSSDNISKTSLNIQPVVSVPDDQYSQISTTKRPSSNHGFQL